SHLLLQTAPQLANSSGFTEAPPHRAHARSRLLCGNVKLQMRAVIRVLLRRGGLIAAMALPCLFALSVFAQQAPVVVQPGAPGKPTKTLPSSTRAKLPPNSPADVQFMQHMIIHHAQAVEMTALIDSHTENKEVRSLGSRISRSQSDEIGFMKRWLSARGEPVSPPMQHMHGMDMSTHQMMMPGMLTQEQMGALKKAKGQE